MEAKDPGEAKLENPARGGADEFMIGTRQASQMLLLLPPSTALERGFSDTYSICLGLFQSHSCSKPRPNTPTECRVSKGERSCGCSIVYRQNLARHLFMTRG